jgi:alpha-glucosidase
MAADKENSSRGIPVMRPLFFYYQSEHDYDEKYEYLLGRDILVAPVLRQESPRGMYISLRTVGYIYGAVKHTGGARRLMRNSGSRPCSVERQATICPNS